MEASSSEKNPQTPLAPTIFASKARAYEFDAIRFMAIVFVIAVHSLVVIGPDAGRTAQWYRLAVQTLFFSGNVLFFLMSGHFNLRTPKTGSSVWNFYNSKLRNIVLPALLVFLCRTLLDWCADNGSSSFFHLLAHNLLSSQGYASIEYWFVYALLGYLTVTPFLCRAFSGLSVIERRAFTAIGLAYQTYTTVLANTGHEAAFSLPIGGFFFVYCLGSFIDEEVTKDATFHWLAPLSAACFVLSVSLVYVGFGQHAQDTSPLFILATLGIYAGLIRLFRNRPTNAFVSLAARHSFTMYLVHMIVLIPLSYCPMMQELAATQAIAGSILLTTLVFGISLTISIIFDETIVRLAKGAYDSILSRLSESRANHAI